MTKPKTPANPPELRIVEGVVADIFDDLANLRLDQNFEEIGGTEKLLTKVPVRRPRPTDWFRVRSEEEYRLGLGLLENREESEVYLATPEVAKALDGEATLHRYMVYTAITRQGTIFLFPVRQPDPDGKWNPWHRSQADVAERAMGGRWVRMTANKNLGGYDIQLGGEKLAGPEWRGLVPLNKLLKIGFKDTLITSLDHEYLKRLRGEI